MATFALSHKIDWIKAYKELRSVMINIGLISAGCVIWVVGMNAVLVPEKLFSGGLTGIALLLHYQFPLIDIGLAYLALNIPLVILGWVTLGRRFIAYTVFGIFFFSLTAATLHPPALILEDHLLAALLAGVICGFGSGLILRSTGSAGGLDILAIFLRKKFGFDVGTILFVCNAAVIVAGAYLHDIRPALYAIIFIFINGKVINMVISRFNTRKSVLIVSEHSDMIAQDIHYNLNRGATFLEGTGAYSQNKIKVILTVVSIIDLPKLKALIRNHDRDAFVIINDTLAVLGNRFDPLDVR